MSHYIFPHGKYLESLLLAEIASKEAVTDLFKRLGTKIEPEREKQ